ncbi:hypothetical protein QBC39DRAFT_346720 [Podospora conica]|nr:hypothetical protein QBC39DRAFT_346720 [Schizothecium conicum]
MPDQEPGPGTAPQLTSHSATTPFPFTDSNTADSTTNEPGDRDPDQSATTRIPPPPDSNVGTGNNGAPSEETGLLSEEEGIASPAPPTNSTDPGLPTYDKITGKFTNWELSTGFRNERIALFQDFARVGEDVDGGDGAPWFDCFTSHYFQDDNLVPLLELAIGIDSRNTTHHRHAKDQIAKVWPKSVPLLRSFYHYEPVGPGSPHPSFAFQTSLIISATVFSMDSFHIPMRMGESRSCVASHLTQGMENHNNISCLVRRPQPPDARGDLHGMAFQLSTTRLKSGTLVLGFDVMAFLSRILRLGDDDEPGRDSYQFFAQHAVSWDNTTSSGPSIPRILTSNSGGLQLIFLARSFAPNTDPCKAPSTVTQPGLRCEREAGKMSLCGTVLSFVERRYSVAGRAMPRYRARDIYPYGVSGILYIRDPSPVNAAPDISCTSQTRLGARDFAWTAIRDRLVLCGSYSGVVEFQKTLCTVLDAWQEDWTDVLSEIDRSLNVKITDITDDVSRKSLMYGDASMQESELYFALLQLLRIFAQSIRETSSHLEILHDQFVQRLAHNQAFGIRNVHVADLDDEKYHVLERNWQRVLKHQREVAGTILSRISRKTDDITSLRAGLYNAIAVREAVKSTEIGQRGSQLNQRLLVFTVVTVLFLPPTFVSTFYGMNLFEELVDIPSKDRFWAVLITVSLFTYGIAIVGMYGNEGRAALLARYGEATGWLSSLREDGKKMSPPDTGGKETASSSEADGNTLSVASNGQAPANGHGSTEAERPAETTTESGQRPKTCRIWDRLPPMNLTRRRMRTPGNDEEAATGGLGENNTASTSLG